MTDGHGSTVKYAYDLADDPTAITYPNGETVHRAYDHDGRLQSVQDWLGHTTTFAYNPDSDLIATKFPQASGEQDTYAHNDDGEMTSTTFAQGSETLAKLTYSRDADGQITKTESEGLPGEGSESYAYDQDDRLTQAGASPFQYDPAGNPTKLDESTNTYNAADELTESSGSTTYTYNQEGQRTKMTPSSGPASTYAYDQAGELTAVSRPEEGATAKIEDSYTYDGDGLRQSETIDGETKQLTWDTSEELPLLLSDQTDSFIYGPEGLPIEQIDSEGHVTYIHHDQQGSTRMLTSSSGEVKATMTYSPYGVLSGHTGAATTPLGYDGQYTSSDTGLIYLRARVYDPGTGQFLSVDPDVEATGQPYAYAGDDPVNGSDPTGLASIFGINISINVPAPVKFVAEEIVDDAKSLVNDAGKFVEEDYGRLAEGTALGICVASIGGAPACIVGSVLALGASSYQNATSPEGFSPAGELVDLLGTLPGFQVAGAEAAGLLGEGAGQTVTNIFTGIIGGGAIASESVIESAERNPCD